MKSPRVTPFMISLLSLALILAAGLFVFFWFERGLDQLPENGDENGTKPDVPAIPLTEDEQEEMVIRMEEVFNQLALSWKRRAAASGILAFEENWKGKAWLSAPPAGAATTEIGKVRLQEWVEEETGEDDRSKTETNLRDLFKSVRAVTYCVFKIPRLERTKEGMKVTVKFEFKGVTEDGGVIERRERHVGIVENGRFVSSKRVSGRLLTSPAPWFADITESSKLQVRRRPFTAGELPVQWNADPYTFLAGLAVGDYDDDGLYDVYIPRLGKNALFHNEGNGTFKDVSGEAGVDWRFESSAALFFDYDNDGDQDILVGNFSTAQIDRESALVLYRNRGEGLFDNVTEEVGLKTSRGPTMSLAAADVDGDGDLDIYACMYKEFGRENTDVPIPIPDSILQAENGRPNQLWINEGGKFREAGKEAGVDSTGWSFAATFSDYDDDGDPDLYVANDYGENSLYRNKGDGTFEPIQHTEDPGFGMGVSWADVNEDGKLDLYVSNMYSTAGNRIIDSADLDPDQKRLLRKASRGNSLFLNGDKFEDGTKDAGVASAGWAWGSVFFDADHDGREDLLVMSGYITGLSEADL